MVPIIPNPAALYTGRIDWIQRKIQRLTIMFSGTGARMPRSERKLNPVSAGTNVRLVGSETLPGSLNLLCLKVEVSQK